MRILQAPALIIASVLVSSVLAGGFTSQQRVEACLTKKAAVEFSDTEGQLVAVRYLPSSLDINVSTTVLAEAILTGAFSADSFVIAIGGGISPKELSDAMLLAFGNKRDPEIRSGLGRVILVFYSHYSLFDDLEKTVSKLGMSLEIRSLDARSKASLVGSGC